MRHASYHPPGRSGEYIAVQLWCLPTPGWARYAAGEPARHLANCIATTNTACLPLQVFGLDRFRECELIHGRWAMLACLGCLWAELQTGVSWVEAGKVSSNARYVAAPVLQKGTAARST